MRNWYVTVLAIFSIGLLLPAGVDAQLGKKGGGNKGGGSKSGGSKPPTKSGGSQSGKKSGGSKPPVKSGGSQSGKKSGGSKPPVKSSGSQSGGRTSVSSKPPTRSSVSGSRGSSSLGSGRSTRSSSSRVYGRSSSSSSYESGLLRRKTSSRSGVVDYGSSSNIRIASSSRSAIGIPDAPRLLTGADLSRDVYREDRTRRNREYRHGYYHYSRFWLDDYFYYPYYYFDYYAGHSVASPFYYYHHLPGYISYSRVRVGFFEFILIHDHHYSWHPPRYTSYYGSWGGYGGYGGYSRNQRDYRDSRYTELDYAIDDIVTSFERGSMRNMQYLVPDRGEVYIELEDYTQYRMQAQDFYDMMADMVETTDTTRYTIEDVQYDGSQVVIYAEHEYRDPWGRRDRKYHTFGLAETRNGYVIEYFRVDRDRGW